MPSPQAILQKMYGERSQTLVFGHRGAKAYAPMNTIPAFELALKQGAHGIELDVHRSKDGYPVIVHDFTVDETTDGEGYVTEKTLAELKELDAGSWFSDEFTGVRIPTLDETFEAVGQHLFINVEIKANRPTSDGVEQVVADCIVRHNMAERVLVSSFEPLVFKRMREILPQVPLGYLYYTFEADRVQGIAYEAEHPYYQKIDEALIKRVRQNDGYVNTWTVNDPQDAVRLAQMGVNCIITDVPDVILDALV